MLVYLLVVKHALADLVLQSRLTTGDKADLKTRKGYIHALDHGVLTGIVLCFFVSPWYAFLIACLDFVLHFIIDYVKTTFVRRKKIRVNTQKFWIVQGVDQIAHYSCYLLYAYLALML
tara:strand:+ start:3683 stop:4036 length:354 start_codon:yes stop_codon:yes gene_type:complete